MRKRSYIWRAAALITCVAALLVPIILSQAPATAGPDAQLKAFATHKAMLDASPYKSLPWQWIGPTNFPGRMTSIAVADDNGKRTIYVGAASGGVWKTEDNGDTWKPIFEHEATASIGDVAVTPSNHNILWVGTGEDNFFRAGIAGTGIYKSMDAGKTWQQMGLNDSGTIGRIIVHPTNPDIVFVAAQGHEWTPNEMRGVYMTTNGGKTWVKSFYRSPTTGAVDLVMDPSNPNILYAAMNQRMRRKWTDPRVEPGMNEGGIWKTVDGGKTWTEANNGLTSAQFRGRVGVDVSRSNPNVVYAIIDSYDQGRPVGRGRDGNPERDSYNRPLPPGSYVIRGLEVFRSDNKGQSWRKVSGLTPESATAMMGLGNTYNWVFTQIRVDTKDENSVYCLALAVTVSHDGGATFGRYGGSGGDNHRMWIDPENPKITYVAHDGGFIMTQDGGTTSKRVTGIQGINGTQFYNVEVDNQSPFYVYGSIQDSGSRRVALDLSKGRDNIQALPWNSAPGGEGSNQAIDPKNPNIVYSHGYYGQFTRSDLTPQPPPAADAPAVKGAARGRGNSVDIRVKAAQGEPELRAQWMAPILVSQHDNNTIYAGYQYLYRSHDRGDTWERISKDLTDNNPAHIGLNPFAIPYQTITQIGESPRKAGVLYVGTDDGHVHLTMDNGKTWTELTGNIPMKARKWVSRIVASKYDDATVYLAQRGREDDDFTPYLWKSTDYGKTWKSIVGNIPSGSINVIREDPTTATTLYVGNDFGVYISTNGGLKWNVVGGNLPTQEVSDLQIQPKDNIIVISTYGRGMWVMDALKVRAVK
jgi:photosystem II stability/assembly factor-like uncharacterized protein